MISNHLISNLELPHNWAPSIPEEWIVRPDDNNALKTRAVSILDLFEEPDLLDRHVLDYGCGTGHVVRSASAAVASAVGYDTQASEFWLSHPENVQLTTDWVTVVEQAPYDLILCFDVLDHLIDSAPQVVLRQIKSVSHADTRVFIRFHPHTSRHAAHQYHDINLAYINLMFRKSEIEKKTGVLFQHDQPCPWFAENPILTPIQHYVDLVEASGFVVMDHFVLKQAVEPEILDTIYNLPMFANRLSIADLRNLLMIQYVDIIVKPKS